MFSHSFTGPAKDVPKLFCVERSTLWLPYFYGFQEESISANDKKMNGLPQEVVLSVFTFLDPTSLCQCALVSREWHNLACDNLLWRHVFFNSSLWTKADVVLHEPNNRFDNQERGYWKSEFKETALTFPHKVLHKIKNAHVDEIWNCQWSPNGELLATGGKDARLIIWNVVIKEKIDEASKRKRKHLRLERRHVVGHSNCIESLDWSHDSKYILSTDEGEQVAVIDAAKGTVIFTSESAYFDARWFPDNSFLAADRQLQIIDFRDFQQIMRRMRLSPTSEEGAGIRVTSVRTHLMVIRQADYMHCPLITHSGKQWMFTLPTPERYLDCFVFTSVLAGDYTTLADSLLHEEEEEEKSFEIWRAEENGTCRGANFSMDDEYLLINVRPLISLEARLAKLLESASLKENSDEQKQDRSAEVLNDDDIDINYEEYILPHFELHLWDLKERQKVKTFKGHKAQAAPFLCWPDFSPNGRFIATGSEDSTIFLFHRVHDVQRILPGKGVGHSDLVDCASWHPHLVGLIASCSDDGSVVLWGTSEYI